MPYEPVYSGELSLSIILSEDLRERTFFEMWMEKICNRTNYKFGYYDDYVTDLQIMPLNKSDAISYEFIVEEAYPKAIGDLQLAYDKENDYLRQEITMCFRKYTPRYIGIQQQPISPNIPPAQIPGNALGPQAPFQSFINDNGRIDRVGLDGSVNGFFSPRN
jgi:hypothetical protein